MTKLSIKHTVIFILPVVLLFSGCKKEAGSGGSASIFGKVLVKDYNSTFTVLEETYYGQEIDVYIIYGDDLSYGDRVKTSYNGSYEFKYLRTGTYHIYVYSKDSTLQTNAKIPIIRDVTIDKKKQSFEIPDIEIFD